MRSICFFQRVFISMYINWLIDVIIERNLKDTGTISDTKFAHDATSRKISVHVGADNVITLNSDLASIMGFSPRQFTFWEERNYKGKIAMDLNRGINSLYVYCDATEAITVADIKAPFYSLSMLPEIWTIWFIDCIRRLSTFQSRERSLPWNGYKGRFQASSAI